MQRCIRATSSWPTATPPPSWPRPARSCKPCCPPSSAPDQPLHSGVNAVLHAGAIDARMLCLRGSGVEGGGDGGVELVVDLHVVVAVGAHDDKPRPLRIS